MLSLALAMLLSPVQDAPPAQEPMPAANPSTCRAAADRLEIVIQTARSLIEDDARASAAGQPAQFSAEMRARMLPRMAEDQARVVAVQKRYPAAAKPEDVQLMPKSDPADMAALVKTCAG